MASLLILNRKLEKRLDYISDGFRRARTARPDEHRLDQASRLEGLVSGLWQSWCGFIRGVLIDSAAGALTASGSITTSAFSHLHIDQIRRVSSNLAQGKPVPLAPQPLNGFHQEPTWGDINKATTIANGLVVSNLGQIVSGLGIVTVGRDVQIVRNATAHMSSDRLADIRDMQLRYTNSSFRHPTDTVYWIDPASGTEAWAVWVDDFRASAQHIVA